METVLFDSITISPPVDRIYTRLGYAKGITKFDATAKNEFENNIENARALITLKGAGKRICVERIDSSMVAVKGGILLASKALAAFLTGSSEILIVAATAGSRIIDAIRERFSDKDAAAAVVYDAVASEMVDASLDWIMNYFRRQLRRENKHLTLRRFSAGYGDFSLDNQKIICNTLEMEKLGVTLTEKYQLVPEKSVTAVAGIMDKSQKK